MRSARLPLMVRAHMFPEMLVSCFVSGSSWGGVGCERSGQST